MSHWFEAHYDDPNVLPYDSSEGGFQWIWGGPYDAGQQLRQEFDAFASDDAIAKLSSDLSDASSEWSGKPDEDDYDDEALSEWIASTDPYFALMTSQDNIEKTAKQKRTVRDGKILHRLLFVNVIASLEAYLGDALAKVLLAREDLLFSFYQDFERFRNVDPKPAGTAVTEEHMKTEVQRFLSWTVWHDMERTGKYYKAALGIQFPSRSSSDSGRCPRPARHRTPKREVDDRRFRNVGGSRDYAAKASGYFACELYSRSDQ
jgi:hypothetical protein